MAHSSSLIFREVRELTDEGVGGVKPRRSLVL